MTRIRHDYLVAALALLAVAGCRGADSAAPTANLPYKAPESIAPRLAAVSSTVQTGWPVAYTADVPTVVVSNEFGAAASGVTVRFSVVAGGGMVSVAQVLTDPQGRASSGGWSLGPANGENRLVASVQGLDSVLFTATARAPNVIARFDLQTIGGRSLPDFYSAGGWQVIGGRYLLADDGTYGFGYIISFSGGARIDSTLSRGTYSKMDSTTTAFFLAANSYPGSQFYQQLGGLFSIGKTRGTILDVTYSDYVDFENERYLRTR